MNEGTEMRDVGGNIELSDSKNVQEPKGLTDNEGLFIKGWVASAEKIPVDRAPFGQTLVSFGFCKAVIDF